MAELLNAAQMLQTLHEHGQDAGSDYNDSDEVDGYFGWEIEADVLTVSHQPYAEDGLTRPVVRRWRLVPLHDGDAS